MSTEPDTAALNVDLGPWCSFLGPNVTPELVQWVADRVKSIPGPTTSAVLGLYLRDRTVRPTREGVSVEVFTPAVCLGGAEFHLHHSESRKVRVAIKAQGKPLTLPGLLTRYAQALLEASVKLQAQKLRGHLQKAARDWEVAECHESAVALQALAHEVAGKLGLK